MKEISSEGKKISTKLLFKGEKGDVISLEIPKNQQLKEHHTPITALLICIKGEVIYEDANGLKITLFNSDYVKIEPMVKHWLNATEDSVLLLIK